MTRTAAQKRRARAQRTQIPKTTIVVQNQQQTKASREAARNRKQGKNKPSLLNRWVDILTYPDYFGPARLPRSGSSARTVLGMDHTYVNLKYDSTNPIQFFQMGTNYVDTSNGTQVGYTYKSTTVTSPFVSFTKVTAGIQFPTVTQIYESSLDTGCIIITYLGSPLSVTGDLIVGSNNFVAGASGATYNTLLYAPGSRSFALSYLVEKGSIRVPLRHLSPVSYEFVNPQVGNTDLDTPFVAVNGMPADGNLRVEVIRNWEVRSSLSGNGLPYETSGDSFTNDLNAFQNASQVVGSQSTLATIGDNLQRIAKKYGPSLVKGAATLAAETLVDSLGTMGPQKHLQRIGYVPVHQNLTHDSESDDDETERYTGLKEVHRDREIESIRNQVNSLLLSPILKKKEKDEL